MTAIFNHTVWFIKRKTTTTHWLLTSVGLPWRKTEVLFFSQLSIIVFECFRLLTSDRSLKNTSKRSKNKQLKSFFFCFFFLFLLLESVEKRLPGESLLIGEKQSSKYFCIFSSGYINDVVFNKNQKKTPTKAVFCFFLPPIMVCGGGEAAAEAARCFICSSPLGERQTENERCETCALWRSLCGHEASSRQWDSAVLVSLMTAGEPDNDQEPASLFAGVHLLAVSLRKEVFLSPSYFFAVFFTFMVQNDSLGCWLAFSSSINTFWRTATRKIYLPLSFSVVQGISCHVGQHSRCTAGCVSVVSRIKKTVILQ